MSTPDQKKLSVFTGWFADGPWRSKTVLIALIVAAIGLWSWYSGIQNSPPDESPNAAPNVVEAPADPAGASPAAPPSKWSKPFPKYVWVSVSYAAGYCLGWLFRKLAKVILVISALAFALLMYGKFTGFDLKPAEEKVKQGSQWAKDEAKAAKDYLKHLLPSATVGSVGIFVGFLRRNKTRESKPKS